MRIGMITVELCKKGVPTGRAFLTKDKISAYQHLREVDYQSFRVMQLYLDRKPDLVDEWPNDKARKYKHLQQYSTGTRHGKSDI